MDGNKPERAPPKSGYTPAGVPKSISIQLGRLQGTSGVTAAITHEETLTYHSPIAAAELERYLNKYNEARGMERQ